MTRLRVTSDPNLGAPAPATRQYHTGSWPCEGGTMRKAVIGMVVFLAATAICGVAEAQCTLTNITESLPGFFVDTPANTEIEVCCGTAPYTFQIIDGALPERSEEHTSELQSPCNLVCRLLLEKKKPTTFYYVRQEPSRQMQHVVLP